MLFRSYDADQYVVPVGAILPVTEENLCLLYTSCVNNALYTWEDVSVSAASNAGANSYRIAVATNPKVINRRKYPRTPVANACTVTVSYTHLISLLENHPWFEVTTIAASPRSAGKTYEAVSYTHLPELHVIHLFATFTL